MRRLALQRLVLYAAGVAAVATSFAFVKLVEKDVRVMNQCELKKEWLQACMPVARLKNGDLVFRHGRGTISNMMMRFSLKDAKYSHAGIICIEHDTAYVYHALGGESTPNSVVRRETLESFCRPAAVHAFGIFRLDLSSDKMNLAVSDARKMFKQKVPFDSRFDLATDSAVYCTEFIYKIILKASGDKNYLTLTSVPGYTYVACDNLYNNKHASFIYSYSYPD